MRCSHEPWVGVNTKTDRCGLVSYSSASLSRYARNGCPTHQPDLLMSWRSVQLFQKGEEIGALVAVAHGFDDGLGVQIQDGLGVQIQTGPQRHRAQLFVFVIPQVTRMLPVHGWP